MGKRGVKWTRALLWAGTLFLAALTLGQAVRGRAVSPVRVEPLDGAGRWPSAVLDINAASADALEELPEIGPALAERIVAARTENGLFAGPEAVLQVPGIGPATWEAIAPFVYFGGG